MSPPLVCGRVWWPVSSWSVPLQPCSGSSTTLLKCISACPALLHQRCRSHSRGNWGSLNENVAFLYHITPCTIVAVRCTQHTITQSQHTQGLLPAPVTADLLAVFPCPVLEQLVRCDFWGVGEKGSLLSLGGGGERERWHQRKHAIRF